MINVANYVLKYVPELSYILGLFEEDKESQLPCCGVVSLYDFDSLPVRPSNVNTRLTTRDLV